ncbi:FUSC family protein [Dyella acidiphila]|uniref:FUSC family protein n=1 Tax=Dyella acidiphila TaxID=2775866 RepID=A0ABR9GFD5_9GAMM|nr:FUSC family protein [Dyella acidiphila]MBE1162766.1 FUSC family protein [Dyella acidiphila]
MIADAAIKARVARFFRLTATGLLDELKLLRPWGLRPLLCAETVSAVVLAILLADLFDLKDRWWVAISAYTVVRGSLKVSLWRALDRIAGTVLGAALAAVAISLLPPGRALFALMLALFAGLGLYRAIGSPRSYAWILGTVTGLLVMSEAHQLHGLGVYELALRRVCDVATGIGASVAVIAATHLARDLRHRLLPHRAINKSISAAPAVAVPALDRRNWTMRRLRALQALQGAISIGVLGLFAYSHPLSSFPQTLISIVAVLLVPLPALLRKPGEDDLVSLRMANRALGCMFAALLAVILLPLIGNTPWLCLLTLAIGVWMAAHVQAGSANTSYLGTQFGIGFIMTFVQDQRWSTDASAPLLRLAGILIGLSALTLVMFLSTRIRLGIVAWRAPH